MLDFFRMVLQNTDVDVYRKCVAYLFKVLDIYQDLVKFK